MKIELNQVADILPNARNARTHADTESVWNDAE
jgi:hypothetical protein